MIEVENRINFLLGRYPQPVERVSTAFFDLKFDKLSLGMPAQLLQNRPDVRQAELELAANGLDILVARAHFFPTLDITAGVGYRAFNPRYIFNPEALAYNAAGDLVAPLINKKAIQAEFLTANARQLQSLFNYQRVVLNAYTEVINRVSMAENYRKSFDIKKKQLDALKESIDVATQLFQNARAEYVEVLLAQRDYMDARMDYINIKRQQLAAVVNTYQALGGGNILPPPPVQTPPPFFHWWKHSKPVAQANSNPASVPVPELNLSAGTPAR
jgi:outer membrane protein TolC